MIFFISSAILHLKCVSVTGIFENILRFPDTGGERLI